MMPDEITITEEALTPEVLDALIRLSAAWEEENSCYGYRRNERADIEGNRIFLARRGGETVGYLFGHLSRADNIGSILPDSTPFFEVEELYVTPALRSNGVGRRLFSHAETAVAGEAECILLSTATKNWKPVFHFYLDELGMELWSARLYKKLGASR